jgi:carboxymethylenebutenolidase
MACERRLLNHPPPMISLRCGFLLLFLGLAPACLAQAPAAPPVPAGPEEVTFQSGIMTLHGFVYKPEGEGPFPAVLWNHGSEKKPGWLPELGALFTSKGYVFFIPHRRGQGRSPGEYIMDRVGREGREKGPEARNKKLVELLEEHLADQTAALTYLKELAYVDGKRIAVAGCSFGGIQTLLAAGAHLGIRAGIDFAGGAQTWRESPELRQRMFHAAGDADVPLLLIQAENDYDIAPSQELNRELQRLGKPHKMIIYPPFGATRQEAHSLCVRDWEAWSADVFSFLGATMAR